MSDLVLCKHYLAIEKQYIPRSTGSKSAIVLVALICFGFQLASTQLFFRSHEIPRYARYRRTGYLSLLSTYVMPLTKIFTMYYTIIKWYLLEKTLGRTKPISFFFNIPIILLICVMYMYVLISNVNNDLHISARVVTFALWFNI